MRLGRPRTLQVCAIGAGLAIVALLIPWPGIVIAALFAVFWIFESSWQPLADAVTVNALRGRDYGRVRLLTSLSFAIATIVAGFLYNVTGYDAAFVLFGLAALAMTVAAAFVPDVARADLDAQARSVGARRGTRTGSAGVALRVAPRLGFVLLAVTLLFVGVIAGFTFLPLRIESLGGSPSDIALSSGGAAFAEIPTMLLAAGVARRIGLRGLFVGSALIYGACLIVVGGVGRDDRAHRDPRVQRDRVRGGHRGRGAEHRGAPAGRAAGDRAGAVPDDRVRDRGHRRERGRRDPVRLARPRRRLRPRGGDGDRRREPGLVRLPRAPRETRQATR